MNRIHIIGRKNSGKTTLIVQLVEALTEKGYRVGTIKHTHHDHELDTPGKDSHRHRESGSAAVGILSPQMNAIFWPTPNSESEADEKYSLFDSLMVDCDLVLVEGDSRTSALKYEVYRAESGQSPLAAECAGIAAVITDDSLEIDVSICPRSDLAAIVDLLLGNI